MARLAPALLLLVASCGGVAMAPAMTPADLGRIGSRWNAEIVARVDQSYAGWNVEIADVDGDGKREIVTGTAPDSRIEIHRKAADGWHTTRLVDHLAGEGPGMVLGVRVVDIDHDGHPEILAGTGQEDGTIAQLVLLETDGTSITSTTSLRSPDNTSSYTHGLATADLDGDGVDEVLSSYCGNGEVIRYDLRPMRSHKVIQLSGSGEGAQLLDVDGDGRPELVVSNGYRDQDARVEIYDLDPVTGDPAATPRITLDELDGERMFYASFTQGDLDGDGRPELIVAWKPEHDVDLTTLVGYRIDGAQAERAYVLARDEPLLGAGYFEKMMRVGDLDGDGRNELVVSTRADDSEGAETPGHVFAYHLLPGGETERETVIELDRRYAESSWLAIGDADNDGKLDLVLATGMGDRQDAGESWVLRLWR